MNTPDPEELKRHTELVITRSAGIEPMFEAFYLESLLYTSGRALAAFERFDAELTTNNVAASIVASVHEALTHCAALSRFFWPPGNAGKLAAARGAKLEKAFGLSETSPLNNRDLRNALEHFDERLDKFLLQNPVGYFFPGPVVGSADLIGEEARSMFRLVDPATEKFILLGEIYEFGPMRKEVS